MTSFSQVQKIFKSKKLKFSKSQSKQLFTQILFAHAFGIVKTRKARKARTVPKMTVFTIFISDR
jgi:hypothetical protein